jgi:hypothetical protein
MLVYRCDLCNEIRDCAQRVIEDTEYDICSDCWKSLFQKLTGKGRSKRPHDIVTAPPPCVPDSPNEPKPSHFPGAPPIIYGNSEHPVN